MCVCWAAFNSSPGSCCTYAKFTALLKYAIYGSRQARGRWGGVAYLQCQQNDGNSLQTAPREREGVIGGEGVHYMHANKEKIKLFF